jgi:hypothetical protein
MSGAGTAGFAAVRKPFSVRVELATVKTSGLVAFTAAAERCERPADALNREYTVGLEVPAGMLVDGSSVRSMANMAIVYLGC